MTPTECVLAAGLLNTGSNRAFDELYAAIRTLRPNTLMAVYKSLPLVKPLVNTEAGERRYTTLLRLTESLLTSKK